MAVVDEGMTLPAVAAAAEVEYRTLHLWLRRGLLRASLTSATGSGTTNVFDEADVLEARILADLRRLGAEVRVLERTAAAFREHERRLGGAETLIINGKVEIVDDASEVAERLARTSPSFVFATVHAKQALAKRASQHAGC
jgi:DNA-binding transcriptional MerR regulator